MDWAGERRAARREPRRTARHGRRSAAARSAAAQRRLGTVVAAAAHRDGVGARVALRVGHDGHWRGCRGESTFRRHADTCSVAGSAHCQQNVQVSFLIRAVVPHWHRRGTLGTPSNRSFFLGRQLATTSARRALGALLHSRPHVLSCRYADRPPPVAVRCQGFVTVVQISLWRRTRPGPAAVLHHLPFEHRGLERTHAETRILRDPLEARNLVAQRPRLQRRLLHVICAATPGSRGKKKPPSAGVRCRRRGPRAPLTRPSRGAAPESEAPDAQYQPWRRRRPAATASLIQGNDMRLASDTGIK